MDLGLEDNQQPVLVEASAPCRIDLGGTLDIRTFHLPLRHLAPCTLNIALDLRTRVLIRPYEKGLVRIASRGFERAEYPSDKLPFEHPMGLMFAVAAYFGAQGVDIEIDSASPIRSALGGSSSAAVALIAAFSGLASEKGEIAFGENQVALLAHDIEESIAGVPCGIQDQLAAVYGGVNVWHWPAGVHEPVYRREPLDEAVGLDRLEERMVVAYCGVPHESKDINGRWVKQFLRARYRFEWQEIIHCTKKFIDSLCQGNYIDAAAAMNEETTIRCRMTPDVLDETGTVLSQIAGKHGCGARFAGAGGGGCVWAVGEKESIAVVRAAWRNALAGKKTAGILNARIDAKGVAVSMPKQGTPSHDV